MEPERKVIIDRPRSNSALGTILLVVLVLLLAWFFLMRDTDRAALPTTSVDTNPTVTTDTTPGATAATPTPTPNTADQTTAKATARTAVLGVQSKLAADANYAGADADLEAVQNNLATAYANATGDAAAQYAKISAELAILREAVQGDAALSANAFDDLLTLLK